MGVGTYGVLAGGSASVGQTQADHLRDHHLGVVVPVFAVLLPQFADYGDAWETVKNLSVAAIVALLITTLLNIIVYDWPFQAALPGLSFGNAFVVRHASFMVSNVVPAGGG